MIGKHSTPELYLLYLQFFVLLSQICPHFSLWIYFFHSPQPYSEILGSSKVNQILPILTTPHYESSITRILFAEPLLTEQTSKLPL